MFVLAAFKDAKLLPSLLRWQINAYTNWSLMLMGLGHLLGQHQWEPFLCTNSMGLLVGFRTAMSQGLDDNLRKKLAARGLPLSRRSFQFFDHCVHTAPALYLVAKLVRTRTPVPYVNAMYGAILSTWFAFRQQAKLDSSSIYVPHPWRRTW